jgi:hypothetical protein
MRSIMLSIVARSLIRTQKPCFRASNPVSSPMQTAFSLEQSSPGKETVKP